MIFKVLYQDNKSEVPVRENTRTMYLEANNEREIREALKGREINIEFIQPLTEEHLAYEKLSEDFVVENL
ncbi:MAG: DNA-dependent RNA polymerase auxiliary subunit epsilon family protein [Amphibacillus sp.]|uniref:DNA-directed RNA polymerase subunit epsilon n=1 Tax=Amphibacillus xylanus (strain ATCC 51415 / DSM 6626 / JCM 7361 / LMG 17667 / NBRC 15112 / Ep01) TaxID=698758 RepID=K0IYY3_AMPXN|nr:DNA-directed RNA polymerase subunit epsilon [Amphibacillus xylanus]NMA90937.1 DNA-dependent RNA polymerase auxiliary subunit epsilon family protein [Amphibacillus sp.]BAM47755.1 hypothetical protein AXY_16230 [Amphibacillus xylanus NBRC 15112]